MVRTDESMILSVYGDYLQDIKFRLMEKPVKT
jgi:hypothetical protein